MMQATLPIHFAPLQGYAEAVYRNAHAAAFGGIDTYYTPFVRLEKGLFRSKDVREIGAEKNRVPHLIPQLIASSAEKAETIAALFVEKGYKEADINLGCPFPVLAKRHNGAGILPYPEEVKALLEVVRRHPEISFSVKMRLGWETPGECMMLVDLLNDLPLRCITMHPRLGKQQYKGEVDLDSFTAFYEACRHPLVYNGDIAALEDMQRVCERFPRLAGLMLGRGLLALPELGLEYKESRVLPEEEFRTRLQSLHTGVFDGYAGQLEGGDGQLLQKMKSFWEYLLPRMERKSAKAIHKSTSLSKYRLAVSACFNARPLL